MQAIDRVIFKDFLLPGNGTKNGFKTQSWSPNTFKLPKILATILANTSLIYIIISNSTKFLLISQSITVEVC